MLISVRFWAGAVIVWSQIEYEFSALVWREAQVGQGGIVLVSWHYETVGQPVLLELGEKKFGLPYVRQVMRTLSYDNNYCKYVGAVKMRHGCKGPDFLRAFARFCYPQSYETLVWLGF
jgi:hypothetical protein